MHALLNIALRAAHDAAEALAHSSDRLDRVKLINDSAEGFMTSMDLEADKTILYHLEKAHPSHSFHSRVSGFKQGEEGSVVWLIDPLLGNRNFIVGYTQFAVSIACQVNGVISHAAIICPLLREEFTASRGAGAQLNARRLRVGKHTTIDAGLIGLNFDDPHSENFLALQRELILNGASPRISGCTALDIIHTAADRLQGGWAVNEDGCWYR